MRGIETLNHRQRSLISHALRHPYHRYTIRSHHICHNIVYQTARTDMFDLEMRGLLEVDKSQKQWYFRPPKDLEAKLSEEL